MVILWAHLPVFAAANSGCALRERYSGMQQASLLELFTSEGCNSCPPADLALSRWVAKKDPLLIALAFHVDYWDYLGWVDQFASPRWSEHQHRRARQAGVGTVYTPQFVLNGQGVAMGATRLLAQQLATPAKAPVSLHLRMEAVEQGVSVTVSISPVVAGGASKVFAALYEHGLESQVRAGENKGERLRHDAVVRALLGPWQWDGNRSARVSGVLPLARGQRLEQSGVAVWVETVGSGRVLQAIALACQ